MKREGSRARGLRGLVHVAVASLLVLPPFIYGGVAPWAQRLTVLGCFAVLLLTVIVALASRQSLWGKQMRFPLIVFVVWILWIGFQCYPLTLEWMELVSPERARHIRFLLGMEGWQEWLGDRFHLSSDLRRTQQGLILSMALLAVFIVSAWMCRARSGRYWLLGALIAAGVVQAGIGGYDVLFDSQQDLWGQLRPYRGFATGTFVNRNHFAGYLEFCLAASLALSLFYFKEVTSGFVSHKTEGLDALGPVRRALRLLDSPWLLLLIAPAIMVSGLLLSQSRMGNLAAAISLMTGGFAFALMRGRMHWRYLIRGLVGLMLAVGVFYQMGQWQGLSSRYDQTLLMEEGRWKMWPDLQVMMREYALTGSGLGSFSTVFPEYRRAVVAGFYEHAHNDYAQFWIETGIIGCTLLFLLIFSTSIRALRGFRQRGKSAPAVHLAALIAMLAMAIHSIADFNLQIPSNAVVLMALMGGSWGCRSNAHVVVGTIDSINKQPSRTK